MKSKSHAVVSLVVAAGALALTAPPFPARVVVAVALAVGVGIDFDHFLVARLNGGTWDAARRCLRDPRIVFLDQEAIFAAGEVSSLNRLVSHVVIVGVLVPACWLWRPYLGALVAASLYAHLLADLFAAARSSVVVDVADLSAETRRAQFAGRTADAADLADASDAAATDAAEPAGPASAGSVDGPDAND